LIQQDSIANQQGGGAPKGNHNGSTYHLTVMYLVLGTLYCSLKQWAVGLSMIKAAFDICKDTIDGDVWYYMKRCILSCIDDVFAEVNDPTVIAKEKGEEEEEKEGLSRPERRIMTISELISFIEHVIHSLTAHGQHGFSPSKKLMHEAGHQEQQQQHKHSQAAKSCGSDRERKGNSPLRGRRRVSVLLRSKSDKNSPDTNKKRNNFGGVGEDGGDTSSVSASLNRGSSIVIDSGPIAFESYYYPRHDDDDNGHHHLHHQPNEHDQSWSSSETQKDVDVEVSDTETQHHPPLPKREAMYDLILSEAREIGQHIYYKLQPSV